MCVSVGQGLASRALCQCVLVFVHTCPPPPSAPLRVAPAQAATEAFDSAAAEVQVRWDSLQGQGVTFVQIPMGTYPVRAALHTGRPGGRPRRRRGGLRRGCRPLQRTAVILKVWPRR